VAAPLLVGDPNYARTEAFILLRKLVREAIETTLQGGRPKGVFSAAEANKIIEFGCFTGIRKTVGR
jgi:hypothetical protein